MAIDPQAPEHPEIAIAYGAVLFGFNSNIIRKRKARYTIGIMSSSTWEEDKHKDKGIKKHYELHEGYYCSNLFSKFITINEYIEFNQIITKKFEAMLSNPSLIFYKSLKENCTFIDEKNEKGESIIEKFGEVSFEIEDYDKDNNGVIVNMKIGGTYIDVSAIYLKTRKKLEVVQSFM